ncbi:MAG TPA: PAS domain S-box protein, partial [Fimbriimonadaceae bacterium]|nr:PAS domain S-box protein [Fimbriimonadaceae bacterium]
MSLTSGLTDSESRLRTVLESIQEGVATFDGDGRVVEFNPAALALHGYSSIEEAHRRLAEFPETFELLTLDRKVVPVDQWPAARVLRGETFSALDLRVRRKDNGAEKVFSYTGTPVFQDGRVALAVVTLQDVTERVLAEEALRKSESQLRDFVE